MSGINRRGAKFAERRKRSPGNPYFKDTFGCIFLSVVRSLLFVESEAQELHTAGIVLNTCLKVFSVFELNVGSNPSIKDIFVLTFLSIPCAKWSASLEELFRLSNALSVQRFFFHCFSRVLMCTILQLKLFCRTCGGFRWTSKQFTHHRF